MSFSFNGLQLTEDLRSIARGLFHWQCQHNANSTHREITFNNTGELQNISSWCLSLARKTTERKREREKESKIKRSYTTNCQTNGKRNTLQSLPNRSHIIYYHADRSLLYEIHFFSTARAKTNITYIHTFIRSDHWNVIEKYFQHTFGITGWLETDFYDDLKVRRDELIRFIALTTWIELVIAKAIDFSNFHFEIIRFLSFSEFFNSS